MHTYRFYFLGTDDHIRAAETLECADDAVAVATATALLDDRRGYASIEVWRGKELVRQIRRSP